MGAKKDESSLAGARLLVYGFGIVIVVR